MSQENENNSLNGKDTPNSRRKFVAGSLAASLLAALPNRKVWATGNSCTISGNMSGNTSTNHQHDSCTLEGRSPGFWHKVACGHPSYSNVYSVPNVAWSSVFGTRFPFGGVSNSLTLHQFLFQQNNGRSSSNCDLGSSHAYAGPDNVNTHLVAAYYNAFNGLYPLSPSVTPEKYAQFLHDSVNSQYSTADLAADIQATYVID